MTFSKRLFDIIVALILIIPLAPVIILVGLVIRMLDGAPVFFVSERMKTPDKGFSLIKFRTMKPVSNDSGVSGGDKSARVTHTGPFLRRSRIDELPQILNVLKGDISFVGPRPPLRQYTEQFPGLYSKVLESRPGITGLASIYYHAHEERLLTNCNSVEETDEVYTRACIPRKAKLDIIYQKNRNLCVDVMLMLKTVFKIFR